MFTGLVEEVGTVSRLERRGPAAVITVTCRLGEAEPLVLGESIAVAGACLTVTSMATGSFTADVSAETLAKTTLGHVDGVGRVVDVASSGDARRVTFEAERALARYLAPKGSVCIEGVSLTVNEVTDSADAVRFTVMLVPHTLAATTLPSLTKGSWVNLEMDVLARYVERHLGLLAQGREKEDDRDHSASDERLLETLRRAGYT